MLTCPWAEDDKSQAVTLTMEDQVNRLVDKVWARLQETPSHRLSQSALGLVGPGTVVRWLLTASPSIRSLSVIAIGGIPGSGA